MISEIIYFNDYTLYNKCQLEARRQNIKLNEFIVKCCEKMLEKNHVKYLHKKPIDFWLSCEKMVKDGKAKSVSEFIEKSCQEAFSSGLGFLELPRG